MEESVSVKRISPVIAGVLFLSLLLGACGSTPTAVPSEAASGLTLTDALGRTVVFEELPQRIVIAGKSSLTIVNTFYLFPEAQERLVGVVVGNQPVGGFISLLDPAWDQKTILAPDAGPEQIAPLAPDVVLLRSFMADSLGRSLAELDVPVVYFDLETPEQYSRDVSTLGQLLGNSARAETIRTFYRERLEGVEQAVEGLSTDQKPRVLLVQYNEQGGEVAFNVPSAAWLQSMEVELAGGVPVWAEAAQGGGWTVVSFEQIAAWDPEQIFVVSYRVDSAEIVANLVADPQWQALQAVQDGAIYGFPADIFSWDQPDPRWILGVTWLAGKIHPNRFPGLDMERETVQFFGQLYGIDEAVVETQILPRLNLEGHVE
jgi:iron complex transport system substrate-binding protein